MVLYIDKENVQSFARTKEYSMFEKCEKLIRNNMDVHYNFSKDEIPEDELLTFWFRLHGDGIIGNEFFCPPNTITPERPLKSNFYKSLNSSQLSSIYLLNDDKICDLILDKSCILIGKIGEEVSTIEKLIIENSEMFCKDIDWDTYCPLLPLTDIIICDNHYFKNKQTYEINDNLIIKALTKLPNSSAVNVVIITKEGEVASNIDLDAEAKNIKRIVLNATNSSKSTVTVLTTYKTHDRITLTNYFRMKSGSCFHLKDSQIKNDVTVEIKSHAIRNNYSISLGLLKEYQSISLSPVRCFGDKKCNYLKFE